MSKPTLSMIALVASTGLSHAQNAPMSFDVAEGLTRFIFSAQQTFDDGMPGFGNAFITRGYICKDGTSDAGAEGTLADGRPVFPQKVIGRLTCDGYFVGEGARTTSGEMVITRQIFEFDSGEILINQGAELADINAAAPRVITGGTGAYAGVGSEMAQYLPRMTDGFGVRPSIEILQADQATNGGDYSDEKDHTEWDSGVPVGPLDRG